MIHTATSKESQADCETFTVYEGEHQVRDSAAVTLMPLNCHTCSHTQAGMGDPDPDRIWKESGSSSLLGSGNGIFDPSF